MAEIETVQGIRPRKDLYYVTDLDRIHGGTFESHSAASGKAESLALEYPGNIILIFKAIESVKATPKIEIERKAFP